MDRFRIGGDVFLKKSQNELPRRTHVKAFRRGQLRKQRSRREETSLNKFKKILNLKFHPVQNFGIKYRKFSIVQIKYQSLHDRY